LTLSGERHRLSLDPTPREDGRMMLTFRKLHEVSLVEFRSVHDRETLARILEGMEEYAPVTLDIAEPALGASGS